MVKKVTPGAPRYISGRTVNRPAHKGPTPAEINRANREFWEHESRKFNERITKRPDDAKIAAKRLATYAAIGQNVPESMESLVAMMAESHDKKHRAASTKGGESAGKVKRREADTWQTKCLGEARDLLDKGKARRDLAGMLASRFERNPQTVRKLLKKARV